MNISEFVLDFDDKLVKFGLPVYVEKYKITLKLHKTNGFTSKFLYMNGKTPGSNK